MWLQAYMQRAPKPGAESEDSQSGGKTAAAADAATLLPLRPALSAALAAVRAPPAAAGQAALAASLRSDDRGEATRAALVRCWEVRSTLRPLPVSRHDVCCPVFRKPPVESRCICRLCSTRL